MAPTRWQPRAQSPQNDDFHTGQSDFNPDEALHSTAQFNAEQNHWTSRYGSNQQRDVPFAGEFSDEPSIEIGRGLKRPLQNYGDIDSSQIVFTFGNDSQYELTGTPTTHNNPVSRKASATRRANEGAKRSTSQNARVLSNLSEKIRLQTGRMGGQDWEDEEQMTATLSAKNTRFGRAKQTNPALQRHRVPTTSAQRGQPSAYDAAESFQLPDISGIEELVQGAQVNTKPVPLRAALSKFRSGATTTPHNRAQGRNDPSTERIPVQSVPVPEDEQRIYSSLQHLRDRITQLETEKAMAWSQLDRYENEVVELRSALVREEQLRRPDSALGSDDETEKEKWRLERTRLQATVRALRQQLGRVDRKTEQNTTVLGKVTTERDNLVTQLGVECFRLSKAEAEVEQLQADRVSLLQQNNDLLQELSIIKEEVAAAKGRPEQRYQPTKIGDHIKSRRTSASHPKNVNRSHSRSRQNDLADKPQQQTYLTSLDNEARQCIATAVQKQFDRLTSGAREKTVQQRPATTADHRASSQQTSLFPGPLGFDDHNATRTMTEFDLGSTRDVPSAPTGREATQPDGEDITELTQNEPIITNDLRQTLERIRRESHKRRQSSVPAAQSTTDSANRPAEQGGVRDVTRKSSFKSASARRNSSHSVAGDVAKAARVVRVQSPTVGDHVERQEDASSAEHEADGAEDVAHADVDGDTSAFIIPDITLQRETIDGQTQDICIQHDDNACTVCTKAGQKQQVDIPIPEFASARTDLPEDATLRPSQSSYDALAKVMKQLSDESVHLHLALRNLETQYHSHDPAVGERARRALCDKMDQLRADCDRKDSQIYSLFDALEAHKNDEGQNDAANSHQGQKSAASGPAAASLAGTGVNRADTSARAGARYAPPMGLDGAYDDGSDFGSIELPEWDGLSEDGL